MINIERIKSRQNDQIKLLKKLSLKKYRLQLNKFKVENLTIIISALKVAKDFKTLFVTEMFIKNHGEDFEFLRKNSGCKNIYLIDDQINKYYSELDTPSGITAVYEAGYGKVDKNRPIIYLNGIKDPGNLGTIMRTSLAFGFINIVVDEECADIYNSKTINAAKDSIFKLNIQEDKDMRWIRNVSETIPIYTADSNGGTDLKNFTADKVFCLVFGSESHGISAEILKLASDKINIKISGKMESLNVAIAAAIILYVLNSKLRM